MATISFKQPKASGVPSRSSSRLDQPRACRTYRRSCWRPVFFRNSVYPCWGALLGYEPTKDASRSHILRAVVRGDPAQQSAKCGMAARASGENFTWWIETGSPTFRPALRKVWALNLSPTQGLFRNLRSTARELEHAGIFQTSDLCTRLARMRAKRGHSSRGMEQRTDDQFARCGKPGRPFCRLSGGHVPERLIAIRF